MNIAHGLLDLIFPRICAGCAGPVADESLHICWECLMNQWPIQAPHCSICGNPVSGVVGHEYVCSLCMRKKPFFDRARSAVHYDGAVVQIMHAFKYERATYLGYDLALFLAACVRTHYPTWTVDAVTFVPLHHRKERERSYNQACLLARHLTAMVHKPLMTRCLVRERATATQTHLNAAERAENVYEAFQTVNEAWIDGRRILLVDDVMTTGATVNECARVLKNAGAARVQVVTVARGIAP